MSSRTSNITNLLIVLPDQMRASSQLHSDKGLFHTPNLNRFRTESVSFTNAISNYPVCSPFRAMMMTGKYPVSNGVLANCCFGRDYELKSKECCWSDILKKSGYDLGYIGKWHLDAPQSPLLRCERRGIEMTTNEWCPPARRHGFDFWYSYGCYDYHSNPMYWQATALRNQFHYVDQWSPEHEADVAIKYLENKNGEYRNDNKPFALVVAMNPPHPPYHLVPNRYIDAQHHEKISKNIDANPAILPNESRWGNYYRDNITNYLAMITGIDDQFGRIIEALDNLGKKDNTIVMFFSDHGDCLGANGEVSKNNPYEYSLRIPFLIRWPEKQLNGERDLLFSAPDIYPTILGLLGFADEIPDDVEGNDFTNLLLNGKGKCPSSQLYLKMDPQNPKIGWRGVRNSKYTMAITNDQLSSNRIVLYDRESDPYQQLNIAGENIAVVKSLVENELKPWLAKTKDEFEFVL